MAHARKEPWRAVSSIPIKAKQIHEGVVLPTPHHLTQAEKCKLADCASWLCMCLRILQPKAFDEGQNKWDMVVWVAYQILRVQMKLDWIRWRHQIELTIWPKHQTQSEVVTEQPCQTCSTQHKSECRCMVRYSLNTILWLTSTTTFLCWEAPCYCYKPKQAPASHLLERPTQKGKYK